MKRQYGAVDLCKFLCALLIVAAHYVTENAAGRIHPLIDYGVSLYVIVVPFFFACGGYFLFKKVFAAPQDGGKAVWAYVKRILMMYGLWSVVYVAFQILTWLRFGVTAGEVAKYALNAVFYSTYRTIWFLPALCIGAGLTWWISRKLGMKGLVIVAGVCYLVGCMGVSYRFLFDGSELFHKMLDSYEYVFESTRNGLFNGFPLVALGAVIAHREQQGKEMDTMPSLIGCGVFAAGFVAEALVLKLRFDAVNANTLILLVPFTYFFLSLCLSIPMASGRVLKWMRCMSTTVFLCQRIWLSALPGLFPGTALAGILAGDPYLGLAYSLGMTLLSAAGLHWLSKRSKLVRAMC